jgi:alpha-1,2-mannosyltransferase
MAHIWQALRSGEWLTASRVRAYCLILLAFAGLAVIGWIALSHDLVDRNGKPIGTDFSSFYAAGALALEGRAADAYNMALHHAREQQLFGPDTPFYSWLYPPSFFLVAAPLALLPYALALAAWQGLTFAFYLAVIGAILRPARQQHGAIGRLWLPVATAFPAVFINLGHGQNGFLSAGLLGAALVALPRRPLVAGVLFGLLSYKPQFALVIPLALVAGRQWRTVFSAAVTVIVLVGASAVLFGLDAWTAFFASTEISRKVLLEEGNVGFEKLQSTFAAIRLWGGGVTSAYMAQTAVSVLTVAATAWAWYAGRDYAIKAALLIAATALASPHVLDYDLMLLAPALAFFVAARPDARFGDYEISLLAFVWIAPLLSRSIAGVSYIPLGLFAELAFCALVLRRAALDRASHALGAPRVAQA